MRAYHISLLLWSILAVNCGGKSGKAEDAGGGGEGPGFLNQDSCFCQIDAGKLEDCSCTTDKIRLFNTDIHNKLNEVLHGDYFRYFQVNLDKPCKFWSDGDGQCGSKNCAIDTCPHDQVPQHVRDHKDDFSKPKSEESTREHTIYEYLQEKYHEFLPMLEPLIVMWHDFSSTYLPSAFHPAEPCLQDPLPQYSKVDPALPESSVDLMNEFCTLDPLESTEGCNYIDLLNNEEKYTGYQGKSAARIWGKIYGDLCFKPKETGDSLSDLCLEEKTFYRILSGLHSSITVHLCSNYLLQPENLMMRQPPVWGRNKQEFQRRFDPKLTNNKGPEWLKNMFYLYLIELRAIGKAGNLLKSLDYRDPKILAGVKHVIEAATQFKYHFDENDLFKSDQLRRGELFDEFKGKFREISHLMDCMGCERCKVWGKLQVTGIGTALKILFTPPQDLKLTRHEVVALLNGFGRVSNSLIQLESFRE